MVTAVRVSVLDVNRITGIGGYRNPRFLFATGGLSAVTETIYRRDAF